MPKVPYNKPATSYQQQVEQLKHRGLLIDNEDKAKFYLQHLNYYRLSAYWLPFEANHATHQFQPDVNFEDVLNLYIFDRELRLLLLDAIERIEVSVRAQWAYKLGHMQGTHAHLDHVIANNRSHWQKNLDDLEKEVQRSDEAFIQHLTATYSESLPPIWAVCEVMSLGLLSRWYANLKPPHIRRAIANVYEADETVFASWLHHLSVIRNVCAHHSRLWNRDFSRVPLPATINKPIALKNQYTTGHKLYNSLIILLHFMDKISPQHDWRERLKSLLRKNNRWTGNMGFPTDWENCSIWQ